MYPIEYIWTIAETNVTTTSITAESGSIFTDQFTLRLPEFIHLAIIKFSEYPVTITLYKTMIDKKADMETNKLVTNWDALSPINFPKNPDIIDAASGKNKI